MWGALLGACAAAGLLLIAARVLTIRKPQLATRVLPYLRDLTQTTAQATAVSGTTRTSTVSSVFGPALQVGGGHRRTDSRRRPFRTTAPGAGGHRQDRA